MQRLWLLQHLLIKTKMKFNDMNSWKYDCMIAKDEKSSDDAGWWISTSIQLFRSFELSFKNHERVNLVIFHHFDQSCDFVLTFSCSLLCVWLFCLLYRYFSLISSKQNSRLHLFHSRYFMICAALSTLKG